MMKLSIFATLLLAASFVSAQNVHNGSYTVLGFFDASQGPYAKPMPTVTSNPAGNSCVNAAAMELDTTDRLIAACINGYWVIVGASGGSGSGGITLAATPGTAGTYFIGATSSGSPTSAYGPMVSTPFSLSIMPSQAAYSLLGNLSSSASAPGVITLPNTGTDGCNSATQALGYSRTLGTILCNNITGSGSSGSSGSGGTTIAATPAVAGTYFVGLYTSGPASSAYGPIASTPISLSILPNQAAYSLVGNPTNAAAAPGAIALPTSGTDGCNDTTHALGFSKSAGTILCNSIAGTGSSTGTYVDRVNVRVFYSSGTYTPTAGMLYAEVQVQAAGGGAGGTPATNSVQNAASGGGGGGGYARQVFSAATIGSSQTVTVGSAGLGGSSTTGGGAGGNAAFGSLIVCTGGGGGAVGYAQTGVALDGYGGSAGTCSGGDYSVPGQAGGFGFLYGTAGVEIGGFGGASFWSPGTPAQPPGLSGNSGRGYGAGASGNSISPNGTASTGAAGGFGLVVITEYISQ